MRVTKDAFLQRAREKHGDVYDYSQVEYVNTNHRVKIVCPRHGVFEQTPARHMAGAGCPNKECVVERRRKTMLERYGVETPSESLEIREKRRKTMLERYNVENPMQVAAFRESHAETCRERFGSDTPLGSSVVREKIIATMIAKHGGAGAMCDASVRKKSVRTNLEKRGVQNVMQDASVREKQQASVEAHFGVKNPMYDVNIKSRQRAKQIATMLERYGVDSGFASPILREKAAKTCVVRFGFNNAMSLKAIADKMTASKVSHGTSNTSVPEENLYKWLCDVFGADDVVRQYASHEYNHACDFYIKSRDLYIELNATWTHGGCWFDDREDDVLLTAWQSRAADSEYYAAALRTWSELDVIKRRDAAKVRLNYIVFWDSNLRDAAVWFDCGCPDGSDYLCMYSWLPNELL